ncbi:MAG TPA: putative Ig domain-containing protein [Burkholderiales bacterium]|nr:putative Ig domain-containing protein [Burkholderiales bacterium]
MTTLSWDVQVTDATGATSTQVVTLTVNPAPLAITSPATLPAAQVGVPYSFTLTATGGTPPYAWSLASGSLPAGLSLSASGLISGTPT